MRNQLPPPGSRAVGLGRHSSDLQNPKSADDQLREIDAYCLRNNWTVVGREKDEAKTGRTTVGRSGFYNVMAAAEAGECDVIVVEDISRFARDAADTLLAARKLTEMGVVLCTVGGGVLSGLELAIRAQMAQEQSEEIGRRVKRGHKSAAIRGRVVGGLAYGNRVVDGPDIPGGNRAVDEAESRVVIRIYEDIAAGVSTIAICAALNREGVPAPGGKRWRTKAITGDPQLMTGIGRNPIYVGKVVFGKTRSKLIASSGRKDVNPGLQMDQVVTDAPHLRIVSDELWQAVQDRLDETGSKLLNDDGKPVPSRTRQPPYVLSGLTKCGRCGQSYSMVGERMGCEGRRLGVCDNGRRVGREDVQHAVLSGLKTRLLQPALLEVYLDEYRREMEKARSEEGDRTISIADRLRELDREIENALAVARAGTATGYAAELLNNDLNQLGAKRKQLEKERRRAPDGPMLSLETDAVIERLSVLADNLGAALKGPERDAARACEIIRSFITRVEITPMDVEGLGDGRGAGPVRVTVEGSLTQLLGQPVFDQEIKRRDSAFTTLDLPNVDFKYYVDIDWVDWKTLPGTAADVAVFSRLLDDADVPVRKGRLVEALEAEPRADGPSADLRARYAIGSLKKTGGIRAIMTGGEAAGWVWNDRDIDDDTWRRRGAQQAPLTSAGACGRPSPVIRVQEPSAFVVVIGPAIEGETKINITDGGHRISPSLTD